MNALPVLNCLCVERIISFHQDQTYSKEYEHYFNGEMENLENVHYCLERR